MRELDVLEKEYVGYKKERAELQLPPATASAKKVPKRDPKKK